MQNHQKLIKVLTEKPHMILSDHENLSSLINFIFGIETGLWLERGEDFTSFTDWLRAREEKHFSASWHFYVLQKNNFSEQATKKEVLFLFSEYLSDIT